eukprot:8403247-Karenia_brevis.AAC.1
MAAAKFLAAAARMPGCDGEDGDASGAYTQAYLGGRDTWISLPKHLWPKHVYNIDEPVVRLVFEVFMVTL